MRASLVLGVLVAALVGPPMANADCLRASRAKLAVARRGDKDTARGDVTRYTMFNVRRRACNRVALDYQEWLPEGDGSEWNLWHLRVSRRDGRIVVWSLDNRLWSEPA